MTPIGYTMTGHPLCLPCFDGDYDCAPDGVTYAHNGRCVEADVAPIHAGDPDDGAPCAGCGLPLAAPVDAGITWACPDCGSTALRVFYSERRTCRVGTYADGPNEPEPWPSYTSDEMVDIDPALFAFACDACTAHDITPCTTGDTHALGHHHAA